MSVSVHRLAPYESATNRPHLTVSLFVSLHGRAANASRRGRALVGRETSSQTPAQASSVSYLLFGLTFKKIVCLISLGRLSHSTSIGGAKQATQVDTCGFLARISQINDVAAHCRALVAVASPRKQ